MKAGAMGRRWRNCGRWAIPTSAKRPTFMVTSAVIDRGSAETPFCRLRLGTPCLAASGEESLFTRQVPHGMLLVRSIDKRVDGARHQDQRRPVVTRLAQQV